VRSRIGQALKLRLTPEVRFEHDDSLDELERVSGAAKLIQKI
jgi:ribosome-binding factor A